MATVVNKADPSVFHVSVNEPDFPQVDWLWDPPGFFTLHPSVPSKYWKLNGGSTDIEEMTAGEKAAVDAAETASTVASIRSRDKNEMDTRRLTRALVEVLIDEINAIRTLHALPDRTLQQAATAIKNKIDTI